MSRKYSEYHFYPLSVGGFEVAKQKLIIVAVLILASVKYGGAIAHSGATGIVKERMDYFKASPSKLTKIRVLIRN